MASQQAPVHISEVRQPLNEDQLAVDPEEESSQFQDADGVKFSEDWRTAHHSFHRDTRQAIVSSNWVHRKHKNKVVSWTVATPRAKFEYGDIFVGLTEADAFNHPGRAVAFDTHGNFWMGYSAQNLSIKKRQSSLDHISGATCEGPFSGNRESVLRVTADFSGPVQTLRLELFSSPPDGTSVPLAKLSFPLHEDGVREWRAARLLVSFRSQMDTVVLLV